MRRFKLVTAAGLLEWTSNDVWHVAATLFVWFGDATGSERISSSGVIVDLAGVWQRKMWAFYKQWGPSWSAYYSYFFFFLILRTVLLFFNLLYLYIETQGLPIKLFVYIYSIFFYKYISIFYLFAKS